jgi:hypothetical protein
LNKEREGDRATINELRRGDEEREEEIAWERGERRKAEALKRLWYILWTGSRGRKLIIVIWHWTIIRIWYGLWIRMRSHLLRLR